MVVEWKLHRKSDGMFMSCTSGDNNPKMIALTLLSYMFAKRGEVKGDGIILEPISETEFLVLFEENEYLLKSCLNNI